MGEKIVVGPTDKGLINNRIPTFIDNDSFPTLINSYQWRGRVKRKRGTSFLNRLQRYFNSSSLSYSATSSITLSSGAANILTGFSLQSNGNIIPGTVTIVDTSASVTYTDPAMNGTLSGSPSGSGTINYASGAITIVGGGSDTITATFNYYPDLPVLGLEDFVISSQAYPGTIAFDKTYSYNILTSFPYTIYDVSFYKNLATAAYSGYVQKTNWTPTTWNGQDYQQFWTVNYQGALWATNGINIPFSITNIGMQYKVITGVSIGSGGPPALVTLTIVSHGLVVGDFVFINEIVGNTGINFQTGYVTVVVNSNSVTVELPNATIGGVYSSGGIAQYLTNRSSTTTDCLRWYDGDPTNGNTSSPSFVTGKGWVNFSPPLSRLPFSIADLPSAQYYLVGARMIVPFKDRLLFIGPVIQTSASGSQVYLQDTIIYSQNGTPYYTASFTGDASLSTTVFNPILVPANQTATANAYWEDLTGFGGFITAGIDQPINTVSTNRDVLILGFSKIQTKLVYSGNDIVPFNFFIVNSELGSSSTFSAINFDEGVMTRGDQGFVVTNQVGSERFDLEIPDEVFQISLLSNGTDRICSQRDFINEWAYFTYTVNVENQAPIYKFPNQTLQYNYRDRSWAIFNESYTHYGTFRKQTGFTWATVGNTYPTWRQWNAPWNAGVSTLLQPVVIAGNQQGFVVFRDSGTGESNSLYIKNISSGIVTSPDHSLNQGDYIVISGALGTISGQVNGNIFSVGLPITENSFALNPLTGSGTYLGGGVIQRMYVPFIQTKQFPVAWGDARKTRLGPQQYLFTTTNNSQIQLLIFLSQSGNTPYNASPVIPSKNVINSSLIYSTVLYTCPESTNLGLTPSNINLNMVTASSQQRIWHRMNTSLIGDTVQIGFTMSDAQMRDTTFTNQFSEIELHSFILDVSPSQVLA
jgi:hypothetical protein